jgi:ferrous iron transport protein B
MSIAGLQGYSFVPLLSSFACAIPGIMSTRTIQSQRERILTMMVAPLMTCSARLPVYVMLIGAFVPASLLVGPFRLQGVVMFVLFLFAVVFGFLSAWLLGRQIAGISHAPSAFVMELPTYKVPQLRYLAFALWFRAKAFLRRAGTTILLVSVVLWAMSTFPKPTETERRAFPEKSEIEFSLAGRIGFLIEPLFRPLGFDWRISASLIPGFAAREVMVGALGTVFAVEDAEEAGLEALQDRLREAWGLPTGLALLMWYVFSPQCLATFIVMRRESGSRKYAILSFFFLLFMAYLTALLTFQLASFFTS